MLDQFSTAGGSPADFDRVDQAGIIFKHAVNGFLNQMVAFLPVRLAKC